MGLGTGPSNILIKIAEAVHIRTKQPDLNRQGGYDLPAIYLTVLQRDAEEPRGEQVTVTTQDIDECASSPCSNGTEQCIDRENGFVCECSPGYSGVFCEIDINECSSSPCLNGGTCKDEVNKFTCVCLPGYAGRRCEIDIDECYWTQCENNGTCTDFINGYQCHCIPYTTGRHCQYSM
ncbi:fibropellin-3-like [Lingula anatina]|uniref:Fibropellin-3-like n=1 Tax=Lingula anatina TaxID=7574 RepID=A0A1S3JXR2_LINAN|nr:fibropellin-3-like [Lingula anatina]|eukprot:XP_013415168.1 fibropellin-3-like [Lingula anatina]